MTRVLADDHDAAMPTDHFALLADFFYTRFDLHGHLTSFSLDGCHSLIAIGNATSGEVIRGELYLHFVAGENTDVIHSHLSGDMSQNFVAVLQLHPKHRVR